MAVLISDVSNALQKVIMPYIRDNLPKETVLLDQLKRNAGVTFMSDNFYAPVRSGRHGGVTNLADDGNKVVSSKSKLGQANVGVKIITGAFDISKLTIDATKTTKGAVENMLTFQADSLINDFKRSLNRQFYSDGYGVPCAQVSGSVGAGTASLMYPDANLDDGRSIDWYGTVNGDIAPNKYFAADQVVGIGTAGADLGTVGTVTGTSLVMTGGPAIAANDAIYFCDGDGEGAGTSEIQGFRLALSSSTGTSTYAGVARNTTGWTPQFGSTSEAFTLSRTEDKYLAAREYGFSGDRYAIFVNKALYKKYGDILTAMRRSVNTTELLGGWTGLEFAAGAGRVGVFLDYDVPDGEVLIVNLDSWTIAQVSDLDWMEDPATGNLLRIADKITYQAVVVWFLNLLCLCPAANARLTQKTD